MSLRFKSFKEYILYLYIHIAYADGSIHEKEKELIISRIKMLFPGEDEEIWYNSMVDTYMEHAGDSDEIVKSAHDQFRNVQFYKKYKVFLDLYEIINADGVVMESEKEAMDKLKQVIGIETSQLDS